MITSIDKRGLAMKPGDIIQTRKYKRKGYAGRKIQVVQIQDDIEINNCMEAFRNELNAERLRLNNESKSK